MPLQDSYIRYNFKLPFHFCMFVFIFILKVKDSLYICAYIVKLLWLLTRHVEFIMRLSLLWKGQNKDWER